MGIRTFSGTSVRVIWNLNISVDRARRVTLGTTMEHLEHVVRQIRGENTSGIPFGVGIRTFSGTSIRVIWNLNISVDRARRVTLGTTMEHLEHVVR